MMKAKNRVQSELAGGPQSPFVRQDGDTSLYPVPCLVVGVDVGTTTLCILRSEDGTKEGFSFL